MLQNFIQTAECTEKHMTYMEKKKKNVGMIHRIYDRRFQNFMVIYINNFSLTFSTYKIIPSLQHEETILSRILCCLNKHSL